MFTPWIDYYFISRGNIVISDLYTSDPAGRYWYTGGWNWRAYASYCVGLALAFPGLVGSLGVERLAVVTSPAYKMFSCALFTCLNIPLDLNIPLLTVSLL